MVAGNHHQRPQYNVLVASFLGGLNHFLTGSLFRLTFHRSDKYILVAQLLHLRLHLGVGDLCHMGSAVTHQDKGGILLCCGGCICKAGFRRGSGNHRLGNGFLVGVDHSGVIAHLAQQRLCHGDGFKLVSIGIQRIHHLVIFRTVHQVGGLHHQLLDTVGNGTLQCLLHIVNDLAVTGLHMVDNDLRGKGAAHGPLGEGCLDGVFDALHILHTAVVVGGAKADNQNLLFPNAVGVQRVIPAGIAGIQAEIIRGGFFPFHQFLLLVGQGIPCSLRGSALGIGIIGTLLHINGINQRCHGIRRCLVVHNGFGLGSCHRLGRCHSSNRLGRGRRCHVAAGTQQQSRCQYSSNQSVGFLRVHCVSSLCTSHKNLRTEHGAEEKPVTQKRDLPKRRSLRIGQILPRKSGSVRHSQFLVTRTFRPVPMVGRFPDFRVIATPRLLAFAMAHCGVTLRFTVTRSYRFFTCFPFTPCPARKAEQRHQPSIIQFYAIITEAVAKCNRNNSFPNFPAAGFSGTSRNRANQGSRASKASVWALRSPERAWASKSSRMASVRPPPKPATQVSSWSQSS